MMDKLHLLRLQNGRVGGLADGHFLIEQFLMLLVFLNLLLSRSFLLSVWKINLTSSMR